jgi:xylose isomerase
MGFTNFASRLNSFRSGVPRRSPLEALHLLSTVPGITATELNYPQHFAGPEDWSMIDAARSLGLAVTALNLRFDPPQFAAGSFTHPAGETRRAAIKLARQAVDIAAACEIDHVILWLGPDGFDYPFQADYGQLWQWAVEGIRTMADQSPAVRISIEPKPSDPRRHSLIRSISDALLLARDTGVSRVGVTLDFCHVLMSGESPALAASIALRDQRLFGIHLNDGYGPADDGLMVGVVHPMETLELLWVLQRAGWHGTIYFDTFPENVDPVKECAANIDAVKRMTARLATVDQPKLMAAQANQDALGATRISRALLLP